MGEPKFTRTPQGEEIVILSREDYEDLCDRADAASTKHALARGEEELLSAEEIKELLDAPTPLQFWRRRRHFRQDTLAEALGTSQGFVSDVENGRRKGGIKFYQRAATVLRVPIDAILPAEED